MSIQKEINLAILISMAVFLLIISFLSFHSLRNLKTEEIAEIEATLLQERRNQLRDVVQNAYSVLDSAMFYEFAQKAISGMRFGENGKNFFYVLDADGMIWVNPEHPELVGKSGRDVKDGDGNNYLIEIMANAIITSEGFLTYQGKREGSAEAITKLVHYRLYRKWNWIVCADIFIDDIQAMVAKHREQIQQAMMQQLVQFIASGILALMLTVYLSVKFFHIRLVTPLHKIIHAVECMSIKKFNMDVSVKSSREINQLADAVERMQNSFEVAFDRLGAKTQKTDHRIVPMETDLKFEYLKRAG